MPVPAPEESRDTGTTESAETYQMDQAKVIRSAGVVGGFTMLSRTLGLCRDVTMAGFFGASLSMSAFVVAFTIPNLLRRLFGEGALSSSFVPVFVDARKTEGDARAWRLAHKVITLAALVLLALVGIGVCLCTLLIWYPESVRAASRALGKPELAEMIFMILPLLRIMLPYMLFICLAALSMAILNSFHHFALPAATPAMLNVIWIATVLLVCPRLGSTGEEQIFGVAWAVSLAGAVQLVAQWPVLRERGYRLAFSFDWRDERVFQVLRLMGPAALGLAVTQFNVVIDRLLATWVGARAPAALFYSERLIYFPLGIFATAMSTVLLPVLSGQAATTSRAEIRRTLNDALRVLMFLMIPASVGLLALAKPIIQMIFEWRNFTGADTEYTRIALQFYAPGLLVFSLAKILVPAFYAHQDTRTPVKVGICTVALNFVLNLTFVLTWPQHLKHAGLAFATVLSESVYAVVLAVVLHRRLGNCGWSSVAAGMGRALLMAAVMALAVSTFQPVALAWCIEQGVLTKLAQIGALIASIGMGVAIYALGAWALRARELREILAAVRHNA